MGTMASQITSVSIVYSTVCSGTDQRKHQSSLSLAFVRGIPRDRWIPRTIGQEHGKCIHLITSSWSYAAILPVCDSNSTDRRPLVAACIFCEAARKGTMEFITIYKLDFFKSSQISESNCGYGGWGLSCTMGFWYNYHWISFAMKRAIETLQILAPVKASCPSTMLNLFHGPWIWLNDKPSTWYDLCQA